MNTLFVREAFGWGVVLWFIGYALGFMLFSVVPAATIGWIITPIGVILTLWVLLKKVHGASLRYYFYLALVWMAIAVLGDYFFLVKALTPADGYYKLDVYLYYALTFILPVIVGWTKKHSSANRNS